MAHIKTHFWLIAILLIAAFLRLYRIADYMEFLGDQGRDVVIVRDFLKNGNLFFIGPQTSIGNMYLGPFYYYLIVAPGLLLSFFNPIGPAIVVGLLGVLTVYLIHRFTSHWFNPEVATIASLLYALSPVVIKYSNFSWNPNVMPLFSLLFFHFLQRQKYILASLSFIMCLNSHYLALLLLPLALVIWLVHLSTAPRKLPFLKSSLLAILVFLVSFTPQILFDLKHHGQNYQAFVNFFTQRETTVNLKAYKAIPQIPQLFLQTNTRLLAGKNTSLGPIISLIYIVLLGYSLTTRHYRRTPYLLLVLWYTIGVVGLGLYKQHIYDHYFGFLFPVVIIVFSYLLTLLPRLLSCSLVLLLVIFSLLETPIRWPAPRQLNTTQAITRSIINKSQGKPFNFALLAKQNYDPGYKYFFYESNSLLYELKDQITDQLYVVCEPFQIDCQPINNPEWAIAAFGWAKIDQQWEINGIKVFLLTHTQT